MLHLVLEHLKIWKLVRAGIKTLKTSGIDDVIQTLIDVKNSAEEVNPNSWKLALYRALIRQEKDYCNWLDG